MCSCSISAVERSGLRALNEGQKITYELQADRRTGKTSAVNLPACLGPAGKIAWSSLHGARRICYQLQPPLRRDGGRCHWSSDVKRRTDHV
jgi:hypothetical protein